jgi:predicted phage terminase large subunit-like protein
VRDRDITPDSVTPAVAYLAAKRMLAVHKAREELLTFTQLMMPDPNMPDDPAYSRYQVEHFHTLLAEALEKVERGEILRLIITLPPRHGKSQLANWSFTSWYIGRNPYNSIITASYNESLAEESGNKVREYVMSPMFAQVFPDCHLRKGSKAVDRMQTVEGGIMSFTGIGGTITGRGGDVLIIDDPLKGAADADSPTTREKQWQWFTQDMMSRLMTDMGAVIIIMCMVGDTPVRMGDGTEKFLKDIRPGDMVATYDEGQIKTAKVKNWANQGYDFCYEIKTASGISVRANERHPFLVQRGERLEWVKLKDLRVGDKICRTATGAGSSANLTDAMHQYPARDTACPITTKRNGQTDTDHHQLVKGPDELTVSNTATVLAPVNMIECSQSKVESALSVDCLPEKMFGHTGAESSASIIATKPIESEGFSATTVTSQSDMEKQKAFSPPPLSTYEITHDEIVSISACGREEVYDVEIEGTENFIANGLVSHNTRWHEDDIVGRITDPKNPCYSAEEAANWKVLHITGLAEPNDNLGRKVDEALWEKRHSAERLKAMRRLNPRGFNANYQGRPTPVEGVFFQRAWLRGYKLDDLPKNLRIYAASDHAVGQKQENDKTCLMCVGVDDKDNIWVLPDLFWERSGTEVLVERMIDMMELHKPQVWWGENDHILKSIGPFLRKRMQERKVYCNVEPITASKDKRTRAQAIRGRMSMGMVRFPTFAPWWADAMDELLKFDRGRHDDFVDTIAHIGRELGRLVAAPMTSSENIIEPKPGTMAWMKWSTGADRAEKKRIAALGGF